ncbi:ATP-binding protein [Streptomyces sp. NPDC046759]|uniref:ATP-binding protein n=1 Tax=Streptomyces sp. NPDC046759 TaxID=3155019 RepID=UPI003411BD7D
MAIPLGQKAADDRRTEGAGPLRFGVAFAGGAARAKEGRQALQALLARAACAGRPSPSAPVVLDAELVISELLTNAIRHAPGPCGLILELSPGELAITVWDTSREEPVVRARDERRVGGHGLHLVCAFSDRVVTTPHPAGKQVTARMPLARGRTVAPGT